VVEGNDVWVVEFGEEDVSERRAISPRDDILMVPHTLLQRQWILTLCR